LNSRIPVGSQITEKVSRLSASVYKLGPLGNPRILSSYLIIDKKVAIVDCGPEATVDELLDLALKCGVRTEDIDSLFLSHIHIDHAGGASKFLDRCKNCTAFIPQRGFKHMIDPTVLNASARLILGTALFDYWKPCGALPNERATSVKAQETFELGRMTLRYILAPGHAPHHNVLATDGEFLFAADALGILDAETNSLIPTTPPPSLDYPQCVRDIEMIEKLNPSVACLAHFGEIAPDSAYFERVKKVFELWAREAERYVKDKQLRAYDMLQYEEILSALIGLFPEYSGIDDSLRNQMVRVDVAGLVDYFRKHSSDSTRQP
jgi:glyoxylase-like metal-dependent hydrolase (beta-lactamase superfamily II)